VWCCVAIRLPTAYRPAEREHKKYARCGTIGAQTVEAAEPLAAERPSDGGEAAPDGDELTDKGDCHGQRGHRREALTAGEARYGGWIAYGFT
jgi:hypothetical protein